MWQPGTIGCLRHLIRAGFAPSSGQVITRFARRHGGGGWLVRCALVNCSFLHPAATRILQLAMCQLSPADLATQIVAEHKQACANHYADNDIHVYPLMQLHGQFELYHW